MADRNDKEWFAHNPSANYRVRPLRDRAEGDELARMLVPRGAPWRDGVEPDANWHVLVVKLPLRRIARILTLAVPDADGDLHICPVALGDRMAIN